MYQYTDHSSISLHDCRAAEMTAENGVLRFLFAEGFYVLADNANNPHHALSYPDPSEAVFSINHRHMESYVTVYIYTDTDTEKKSLREEISIAE